VGGGEESSSPNGCGGERGGADRKIKYGKSSLCQLVKSGSYRERIVKSIKGDIEGMWDRERVGKKLYSRDERK